MSVTVTRAVWRHSRATANTRLVLLALATFAIEERVKRDEPAIAYPSQQTLAGMCRCSRSTVALALVALEDSGEIERTGVKHWGKYRGSVEYELLPGVDVHDDLSDSRTPDLTDSRTASDEEDPYLSDVGPHLSDSRHHLSDSRVLPVRPVGHKQVTKQVENQERKARSVSPSAAPDLSSTDSEIDDSASSLDAVPAAPTQPQQVGQRDRARVLADLRTTLAETKNPGWRESLERRIADLEDQVAA